MKLFLHVGMGKTGSTAIQKTFRSSGTELAAQQAAYLGSGFDLQSGKFSYLAADREFLRLDGARLKAAAASFAQELEAMRAASGTHTFLLSNEALWGVPPGVAAFIGALPPGIETTVIGYMRRPVDWLPSAYAQWGVAHKRYTGRIRSYDEVSPTLLPHFAKSISFADLLGSAFEVYDYGAVGDVVLHIAERMGIALNPERSRFYERRAPSELALRAVFNDSVPTEVLPVVFERATLRKAEEVRPLEELAKMIFDYSATEAIIQGEADLFQKIKDRFGFDLLTGSMKAKEVMTDLDGLRREILDYVMTITLSSAKRIQELEARLDALEGPQPAASGPAATGPAAAPRRTAPAAGPAKPNRPARPGRPGRPRD